MDTSRRTALALVAALAAALAGCGGDSGSSSSFKEDYQAQRAALNKVSDQIGAVFTSASGKTDAQVKTEFERVEKQYRAELDKLDGLEAPEANAADFDAVRKAARVLDTDLVQIVDAATSGDGAKAKSASEALLAHVPTLQAAAKKLAQELGLPKA